MRSIDGLTLEQIGRAKGVRGHNTDPELGEGRLPPGSPVVYMPVEPNRPGQNPVGGFVIQRPSNRRQFLGDFRFAALRQGRALMGYPPTAPPAGSSTAVIPPAWAIRVSPDNEQRNGSPSLGRY